MWKDKTPRPGKASLVDVSQHLEVDESDAVEIYPHVKTLRYKPKGGEEMKGNTELELYAQYKTDREFIVNTCAYKFPRIKKLKIQRADCITGFEKIQATNKFMSDSFIYPMKYFKIS